MLDALCVIDLSAETHSRDGGHSLIHLMLAAIFVLTGPGAVPEGRAGNRGIAAQGDIRMASTKRLS